mmetsp:Transcript_39023/g.100861  ORF Transcript_39023/g.100861 Transcript_39023/m.100861 type:complete len:213 (-) Transcript_39023:2-640(-)
MPRSRMRRILCGKATVESRTMSGCSLCSLCKHSASIRAGGALLSCLTSFRTRSSEWLRTNQTPRFRPPCTPCAASTFAEASTPSLASSCDRNGSCSRLKRWPAGRARSSTSRARPLPRPAPLRCPLSCASASFGGWAGFEFRRPGSGGCAPGTITMPEAPDIAGGGFSKMGARRTRKLGLGMTIITMIAAATLVRPLQRSTTTLPPTNTRQA